MKKLSILSLILILFCGVFCFSACKDEETKPTTYNISVEQAEHGVTTVNTSTAKAGDEITVQYFPNSGYELITATVNDAAIVNGKFVMPEADAVVKAYFQPIVANEIPLKVGSYVCAGAGYDGNISTSVEEWYNIITVNNNNTFNAKFWLDGDYVTLNNINAVREGNMFNVNITGFSAKVYILDENTLICQYEGSDHNTIVFHYVENVKTTNILGTHKGFYIEEQSQYWSIIINVDNTIQIDISSTYDGDALTTISGTFEIYGNRMLINATNGDKYCAIIETEYDIYHNQYVLRIRKICQFVEDGLEVISDSSHAQVVGKVYEVLSDSMAPTFRTGDKIIVKFKDEYNVGDIITFSHNSLLTTHRLIYKHEAGGRVYYICHGDNVQALGENGGVIKTWQENSNWVETYLQTHTIEELQSNSLVQVIEVYAIQGEASLYNS